MNPAMLIIFLSFFSVSALAQTVKQKYALKDLDFMAGNWKATSAWGDMDEIWSNHLGNCMMGSYRCVKNEKIVFYEFMVIEQQEADSVPVLKLRHFNPGSIGWEDKDNPYSYLLTFLKDQKAVFERPDKKTVISYERLSQDTLKSTLTQETSGEKKTTEFIYSAGKNKK